MYCTCTWGIDQIFLKMSNVLGFALDGDGDLLVHVPILFIVIQYMYMCARLMQLVRSLTANQEVPDSIRGLVEG